MHGGIDEFLAQSVVAVNLRCNADPARHAAAHDGGGDVGNFVGPNFVVTANAQEQATAARTDEQIAVEEICPSLRTWLFRRGRGCCRGWI